MCTLELVSVTNCTNGGVGLDIYDSGTLKGPTHFNDLMIQDG